MMVLPTGADHGAVTEEKKVANLLKTHISEHATSIDFDKVNFSESKDGKLVATFYKNGIEIFQETSTSIVYSANGKTVTIPGVGEFEVNNP